jgi:hypothetical protein
VKVVVKTDEYTIYQRRDERYAVKDAAKAWVNGDAKVAILVQHELVQAPLPAAPSEEPEAAADVEPEPAEEAAATEEEAGDEASAEEGEEEPKTE